MTERIIDDLRIIAAQASEAANKASRSREKRTGNFHTDIAVLTPNIKAHKMLATIREGAELMIQAFSLEGLKLPNGELFKVSLTEPAKDIQIIASPLNVENGLDLLGR